MSTFSPFRRSTFRPKFRNPSWQVPYQDLIDSQFSYGPAPDDIPLFLGEQDINGHDDLTPSLETLPLYLALDRYTQTADELFDFSTPVHRGHLFDAVKNANAPLIQLLTYQLFGSSTLLLIASSYQLGDVSDSISNDFGPQVEAHSPTRRAISRLGTALDTAMNNGVGIVPLASTTNVEQQRVNPDALAATGLILSLLRKNNLLDCHTYITGFSSVISPQQIIILDTSVLSTMTVFDFDRIFSLLITPQYELYRDSLTEELWDEDHKGDSLKVAAHQSNPLINRDTAPTRRIPRAARIKSVMTYPELRQQVAQVYAQTTQATTAQGQPRISGVSSTLSVQSRNDPSDPNVPGLRSTTVHDRNIYLWIDVSPSVSYKESVASLRIAYDILKHMRINVAHVAFFAESVSEVVEIPIAGGKGLDRFLARVEELWVRSNGTRIDLVMNTIRSSPIYSKGFNLIVTDFGFSFSDAQPYNPNIFFVPVDKSNNNIMDALDYYFLPSLMQYAPSYSKHILGVRR